MNYLFSSILMCIFLIFAGLLFLKKKEKKKKRKKEEQKEKKNKTKRVGVTLAKSRKGTKVGFSQE